MWALLVIALALACWGTYELHVARQLQVHGVLTTGVVVEVDNGRYPSLWAQYTAEGRALEESTGRFADEEVGDSIELVYDETHPQRFHTLDFAEVEGAYTGPMILYTSAAVVALAAVAIVLLRRRPPRRRGRRP